MPAWAVYLAAYVRGPEALGLRANDLSGGIIIELLAIHAFPFFLGIFLYEPAYRIERVVKPVCALGLVVFYSYIVLPYGRVAAAAFGWACVSTYAGVFFGRSESGRVVMLIFRWAVATAVFVLCFLLMLLLSLASVPRTEVLFGFFFFLTMSMLELFRFYDVYFDRLFEKVLQRLRLGRWPH
jgi:hypothetical protein